MKKFQPKQWLNNNEPTHERKGQNKAGYNRSKVTKAAKEKIDLIAKAIEENEIDITANYEDWIKIGYAIYNVFGDYGISYYHKFSKYNTGYSVEKTDETWNGIKSSCDANTAGHTYAKAGSRTIINIAKKYNIDVEKLYNENIEGEIANILQEEIASFRFNTLIERVEFKYKDAKDDYTPMSERDFKTIYIRLKKEFSKVTQGHLEAFIYSKDITNDFDPVKDYLEHLQEWDETQPDYISDLFNHLQFDDEENKDFYLKFLKKWFVNMLQLALGNEDDNQIMPVFIGKQQVGKTYFAKKILPPKLSLYFHTVHPGDKRDKDSMLLMSESLIMLFDEFQIGNSKSSAAMKSLISSSGGRIRDSYGHFREQRKRHCSYIGTSNEEKYIYESEGDRRYLSILVKSTTDLNEHPLPYEGAYAQAWYYIQHKNFEYRTNKADAEEISKHNKRFVVEDICEILIMLHFRKPANTEKGIFITIAEIIDRLHSNNPQVNPSNIGKAMRRLGFDSKAPKNNIKYYVMEVKKSERDEENIREGIEHYNAINNTNISPDKSTQDNKDGQLNLGI